MDPRDEERAAIAAVDCPRCHQLAGSKCRASDDSELPTPPSEVLAHWARVQEYRGTRPPDGNAPA